MHVRRALALTLAVPLLLAGCSDDPEPTPKMPDPTSSSPSPTESETPEAESAEDFIRRWADALREMQVTGKTDVFRSLGPSCDSCSEAADRVEQIYADGGAIEWDGWSVLSIDPLGTPNEFRVVERSAPTRYRESASSPWRRLAGGRTPHVIELDRAGSSWVVVRTAELAK